jgi:N-acetylglucosaminyldiphosphoundecaprenol N-acetyl-beta-D-mannosaminyltransferase
MVTPDGTGMVIASRILGGRIRYRITGSDIFLGVSEALNQRGNFRYFFLGSSQETLATIQDNLRNDFPNIEVTDTYSPSFSADFGHEENRFMIDTVNQASPDVLWVGMTAPKQEKWIYQHKAKLDVGFIGAIGAAFDFYAGTVKRSHPYFQEHGLEWLPRMFREPKRLWYRNFVSFPRFLLRVLMQRLSSNKRTRGRADSFSQRKT